MEILRDQALALREVNSAFAEVSHQKIQERARGIEREIPLLGLAAFLLTGLLGLRVQHTIGPRITQLVRKVRRFQGNREIEKIEDKGADEISLLSHAIDSGFRSIAEREDERARFLAITAHELKLRS